MFALLSFASISLVRRNRRRTVLTMLAVACATLVLCAVTVLPYVTDRIAANADMSPRLVVMNRSAMRYGLPESYSRKVADIDGVVAVNRMTWFGGIYDDPHHQFSTVGVDADTIEEMWPEDGFDPAELSAFREYRNGALVGSATMRRFRWKVGQNIILKSQIYPVALSFRIVGSYSGGADPRVFMFRRDYLEETLHNAPPVDMMWVRCANSRVTTRIAEKIDSTFHNSSFETETDTEKQFLVTYLVRFQSIGRVVQAVGFCAVIAIGLAVLNACSMTLRERRSEIAVMRTVGFADSQILASFMAEWIAIALIGGVLGTAFAAGLLDLLRGTSPALGPALASGMPRPIMLSGILMALGIGGMASFASTLSALRAPVAQAMREVS